MFLITFILFFAFAGCKLDLKNEQNNVNVEVNAKAIWQDPNNVVILWDKKDNCKYKVFRSASEKGEYEYIGESDLSSYRDDTVEYPNTYFYKIEESNYFDESVNSSKAIQPKVDSKEISSVSVIMYHNFITEEDIRKGVEFEEYSISPETFEEDLIWLRDNGYTTITSADLLYYLEHKEPIPEKAVILSIDDGSWGVYTNAWPLLKEYNMKADFNVIGIQIDETWDILNEGGTRSGLSAPYCTWEELVEMSQSGAINICSHTYGLHFYNSELRIGMSLMDGESPEDFAKVVKDDYDLAVKCIKGWVGKSPRTVAYPYSRRSEKSDEIIFKNTGYQVLMAGEWARGTAGNYFVTECDFSNQLMLMSRPCRMDGTPISVYLEDIELNDSENGVN